MFIIRMEIHQAGKTEKGWHSGTGNIIVTEREDAQKYYSNIIASKIAGTIAGNIKLYSSKIDCWVEEA